MSWVDTSIFDRRKYQSTFNMMRFVGQLWGQSLLARLARMLIVIALLSLVSLFSSLIVLDGARGEAAAINVAGSLRMKAYRAVALLDVPAACSQCENSSSLNVALDDLGATLRAPAITQFIPQGKADRRAVAYRELLATWNDHIRPMLLAQAARGDAQQSSAQGANAREELLFRTANFVTQIDGLVTLLQENVEAKIALLRFVQGLAITAIFIIIAATIYGTRAEVLVPLKELREAANRMRNRDLTVRVNQSAENDLDGLGMSFNLMAEDLDKLYRNLEQKVAEKTASLERSNKSLELLYHTLGRLYPRAVNSETHLTLLHDFEATIGVGRGLVCFTNGPSGNTTNNLPRLVFGDRQICGMTNCTSCSATHSARWRAFQDSSLHALALPLRDSSGTYGILQWVMPDQQELEPWQIQLLEALATHMGIAIGETVRAEQSKRWSVYEERTILARELHDSLAQSLAYMRIQMCRLKAELQAKRLEQADAIVTALDDAMASAYNHLRELLSTFRLKTEDDLVTALEKSAAEFSIRASVPVQTDLSPLNTHLNANEEINLLQITREALANAAQHAQAKAIAVRLEQADDGAIVLSVDDDGTGLGDTVHKTGHHGLAIMRERAKHLHASIDIINKPQGGTRVVVRFAPGAGRHPNASIPSHELHA